MNSCSIAYAFYENDFRVFRYAEALVSPGSRTDAFGVRGPGKKSRELINGVTVYRIQERVHDKQGGPFDYLIKMGAFFVKSSILCLWNHLRYRYDVILIHNVPDFFVFIALIPRLLGAKIIFDIHDIMPEFFCQRFGKPLDSRTARALMLLEKSAVGFSDALITGNELWRNKVTKRTNFPKEKCLGMVNYPHMEFFRDMNYTIRQQSLRVIYPGHLSHHHGIDIAVRAMPLVVAKVPHARFDIYAYSWIPQYRTQLENLIRDLDMHNIVTIYPPHDFIDLVEVYKSVDIGIVPKRGGFFAGEAFSSKMLDYMAAGIPIVASRTIIDEYYFDDSQIRFFEPENHEELAEGIIDLYYHPAKRMALSRAGRQYARQNNWDIKKEEFLDLAYATVKEPRS
ncbi:MAG: glycosyltransferase [Chitinispirillaceae bacterium]|jgi:glycosyltransferase involved in cell wall biosynthesis|nr:glycosyltransferase [Chitinispirillaceae bacterium]